MSDIPSAPQPAFTARAFRLGKPYRTADMPPGRHAYAVKMRIDNICGLQVRLEFASGDRRFVHKKWHNADELL